MIAPVGFDGDPTSLVEQSAYTDKGVLIDSAEYSGLDFDQAFRALTDRVSDMGIGAGKVNYRIRDWGVSRQRYWGAPIPVIHCPDCGVVPVPDADLPVLLPEDVVVDGAGSPLARMEEFRRVDCPACGGEARRETDTFDTFMESSWYFARFACPDQGQAMFDQRVDYWLPVDHYVGGIEHAILHLLYSRLYVKLLRDEGLLSFSEPFTRLLTQGMVLKDGAKMSKSKGNTVDPQSLIDQYGADTARLFIIFAAPPEQSLEWSDEGVAGAHRFLKRLWSFVVQHAEQRGVSQAAVADTDSGLRYARAVIHTELRQANYDFDKGQFNTVVSAAMKMLNELTRLGSDGRGDAGYVQLVDESLSILLRVLAPIVPHITHELWTRLCYPGNLLDAGWPQPDADALKADSVEVVVQVNGKLRGRLQVPREISQKELEALALREDNVHKYTRDKQVRKIIVVPGKLVNIVVQG